jgi:hypothetical protein
MSAEEPDPKGMKFADMIREARFATPVRHGELEAEATRRDNGGERQCPGTCPPASAPPLIEVRSGPVPGVLGGDLPRPGGPHAP